MSVAPVAAPSRAETPIVVEATKEPRRFTLGSLPLNLALILLTIIWVVPTLGLLVSSFRPGFLISRTGWWTALAPPFQFTLQNYSDVLQTNNLFTSFINSLTIAIPATVMPIAIASFAAYAFAWMRFPLRNWLFLLLVGLLAVPLQMTLIPVLSLFKSLGLSGNFFGVWIAHTAYGLPFAIYLLRNFFGALPGDLFESAQIDGAGPVTMFFRLVLPLSVPALASLAIFQFLWTWNDLLVALVYLGSAPQFAPMTVTIANLVNSLGSGYELLTAAAFISMALPLVVFLALQRYFVRGMTAGAVKG
ncbi:MAG: carbohydrate ABC transporter permease [Chloroflexi bacterium]|nr:MAG: carbohydrate ABC transporter permease [Chloroflexota bacterium]TMD65628.1 MAG: carbohydrate ABC transporter permease [Chloroflexota bacterium]